MAGKHVHALSGQEVPHPHGSVFARGRHPAAVRADSNACDPRVVALEGGEVAAPDLPEGRGERPKRHGALAVRLLVEQRPDEDDPVGYQRLVAVRHEASRHLHSQQGEGRVRQRGLCRQLKGAPDGVDLRVAPLQEVAPEVVQDGPNAVRVQLPLEPLGVVQELPQRVEPEALLEVVGDVVDDVAVIGDVGHVIEPVRVGIDQGAVPDAGLAVVASAEEVQLDLVDGDVLP
mmetsp:Transcript_3378/g.7992  ORF Transcript_3378/g.7992 Transcript_3378/m.7992 type:complete len:231 (-) Transcript_3378:1368-2060(-)